MPAPTPVEPDVEKSPRVFKINRFQIGLNVLIQILLGLALFGMINYLAFNHFKRWDFSRDHKEGISDQSQKVIVQLKDNERLKMIILVPSEAPVFSDIQNLVASYQLAAKKAGKIIDVETINPFRNLNRAKELQQKYKFGAQEALVILDYQGRTKFVNVADMVIMTEPSDMATRPELKGFKGEQALTQGLLEVIEPAQTKIYFVGGLGGPDFVGAPYNKTILEYLKRQNLGSASLNLLNVDAIPADAKAVFITAPKYDLTDRALGLLKDYWSKKGRIFVMLDPNAHTPKLTAWLAELGLKIQDDRVKKTENLGGGMMGVYKQVVADFQTGHPVTKDLFGTQTIFDGPIQTIQTGTAAEGNEAQRKITPLIKAAEGFWGETNYNAPDDEPIRFDPGIDHAAPLILAAAVEQGAVADERVKVDSSRMICVANADFLQDQYISQPNLDFTLAAVNWLANREELISIAPKLKENFRLGLEDSQLSRISLTVLIIIPALIGVLGFGVCWSRRR